VTLSLPMGTSMAGTPMLIAPSSLVKKAAAAGK
jgi:hypothetical protein